MAEEYPSNSNRAKNDKPAAPEKKVEAVVSGGAKTRKKSEAKKLADTFISEDASNVKNLQLDRAAASAAAGQVEHLSDFIGITHFSTTSSRRIFTVRSFSGVISQWNVASPLVVMLSARMPVSPHSMKQSASPQTRYQ